MSQAPVIEVRALRKSYGEVHAVEGVDLHVGRGEIFSLLGPNGAGKTTAVEILEGYRRRDSGDVRVLGHDPARPTPEWRSRIGIVLQEAKDTPELTVSELVRHVGAFYPAARDPDEVVGLVGLSDKATTRVRKLSGGQRRRLDVALGIVGDPELLFLDEPTTGFDPQARHAFWDLVTALREAGTTILLTTHYLEEAEHLADRVAVIARGRVVAEGPPRGLIGDASARATVRWSENGVPREVETGEPTRVVTELAARFDGEVPGLAVTRPTLESTYLRLIEGER